MLTDSTSHRERNCSTEQEVPGEMMEEYIGFFPDFEETHGKRRILAVMFPLFHLNRVSSSFAWVAASGSLPSRSFRSSNVLS